MESIIKLLPESLSNQIAAGEVVQRPASIVKELMENSVDAGATEIHLVVKEGGKTLVKVMDNGKGMSARDARMAFEKHATSKIGCTEDLFKIRTMGFRGEALASIAAVAQVELRTRQHGSELGTRIRIEGSQIKENEPDVTSKGTSLSIKNLFFNVPARRNFLKSNPVETRHIFNEFERIALAHPDIKFSLISNGESMYNLTAQKTQDRIISIFGRKFNKNLIWVKEDTPYINVSGYLGSPDVAKRARGGQFFYVNGRFFKSPYLNHAINRAFEDILPKDKFPFFCLYLEIDPSHVDINIHPTKTEVKFDDEANVYALILSVVRMGIGTAFTPLKEEMPSSFGNGAGVASGPRDTTIGDWKPRKEGMGPVKARPEDWDKLYSKDFSPPKTFNQPEPPNQKQLHNLFAGSEEGGLDRKDSGMWLQLYRSFIMGEWDNRALVFNQNLMHERILFERYMDAFSRPPSSSQQLIFPQKIEFTAFEFSCLQQVLVSLHHLGFDMKAFGELGMMVQGLPTGLKPAKAEEMLKDVINSVGEFGEEEVSISLLNNNLARTIARRSAIQPNKTLSQVEMKNLVEELFACKEPAVAPSGKPTFFELGEEYLLKFFQQTSQK